VIVKNTKLKSLSVHRGTLLIQYITLKATSACIIVPLVKELRTKYSS